MKPLLLFLLALACTCAQAKDHGRGHNEHEHDGHEGREHGRSARYFRSSDRQVILSYYGGTQNLPPGLARKWRRTGSMPPGWERRFRPLPVVVVRQLPPVCATCGYGVIDNCAVVYDRKTRVVLDVMALIDDLR
jgi:hypothetical protein